MSSSVLRLFCCKSVYESGSRYICCAKLIEGKIIQERIDEAEMPDAKTYTMDEVKAHLEKWSKEQHPSAYWHQIPWGDSTD